METFSGQIHFRKNLVLFFSIFHPCQLNADEVDPVFEISVLRYIQPQCVIHSF